MDHQISHPFSNTPPHSDELHLAYTTEQVFYEAF